MFECLEKKASGEKTASDIFSEIMKENKHGDIKEELFSEINEYAYRVAMTIVKNHQEAEEVAQETCMKILKYGYSYTPSKSKFTTWIYNGARNAASDIIAKRIVRKDTYNFSEVSEDNKNLESLLSDKNKNKNKDHIDPKILESDINRNNLDEEALYLISVRGMSYQEVADLQGRNLGTIKSASNRARENIARRIKERERI